MKYTFKRLSLMPAFLSTLVLGMGLLMALGIPYLAWAGMPGDNPPNTPSQSQSQQQGQEQAQVQIQAQDQSQSQQSYVAVNNANDNSNDGNKQITTIEDERQAPSVGQGSVFLSACGFGGTAGGSQTGGAAFLGVAFITPGCWDEKQIANEAAFGNLVTACELNRLTRAGKRNMKRLTDAGLTPEPCSVVRQPVQPVTSVPSAPTGFVSQDLSGYATREEMIERDKRVLESAVSK